VADCPELDGLSPEHEALQGLIRKLINGRVYISSVLEHSNRPT
jgi:hypothetical protein